MLPIRTKLIEVILSYPHQRCRAGKTGTTTMSKILLQTMGKIDFYDANAISVQKAMSDAKVKEENYPATRR